MNMKLKKAILVLGLVATAAGAYARQIVCEGSGCEERCVGEVCGMKCAEFHCHQE